MTTHFTEIRAIAMGIDVQATAPAIPVTGQTYFDTALKRWYIYNGTKWYWAVGGTTTSTSTTSTSTTSTSTTSTSTTSSSTSTSTTSTSTTSTSTSTTLY